MRLLAVLPAIAMACVMAMAPARAADGPRRAEVRDFVVLPADFRHPEGLASDPATGTLYVGSFDASEPVHLRRNQVLRLAADGTLLASRGLGESPLTGLAFAHGHVYFLNFATSTLQRLPASFHADSPVVDVARLPGLSPAQPGERSVRNPDGSEDLIRYGSSGFAAVNGLAFDADGSAYVSDSFQGAIFRVPDATRCAPCKVETLAHHPLLATTGALPFGANGLAFGPGDDRLYINNAGDGRVLEMDLASGDIRVLAESIHGADGLLYHEGLLWVAANQDDAVVALDSDGRQVARVEGFRRIRPDGTVEGLLFPSAIAVAGSRMIVANLALPITPARGDEWEEAVTRWNLVQFDLPRPAQPAVSAPTQYVDVDGDRIAYRAMGHGPLILLVNRLRGTLDTWDPLFLDELASRYTVVTVDYPGIAYSQGQLPDDMAAVSRFIDGFAGAIGADRFALLGWSWGGLAAQAYLLDHPQRVTHAILVGTNPPGRNAIPLQPEFLERAFKPVNDLADEEVLFFEPASAASRGHAQASRGRIHARPGVDARIPSTPESFAPYFKAAERFHEDPGNRRERLAQTPLPILVVSGDHDTSTAGQNWFPLIGSMRNAQFVYFSETGHAPQHQHPALIARYIHDFIAGSPAPDGD